MLLKRVGKKVLLRVKLNRGRRRRTKRFENLLHALEHYCTNTSLHGLRYLVDPELRMAERFVWLVIFAISAAVASKVIYTLALRFQAAPTSIGIESMNYKISGVPFPSVTLCPNDRVDWDKALALEDRIFTNATDAATVQTFRDMLVKLSMLSFGDFDELSFLKQRNLEGLAGLNVTEILLDVIPTCEDLFSGCWWRNSNRNCCDIFEVQKTEYGFCYAFNSELAEPNARRNSNETRPRRASGYGDWSGVKVTVHLANVTKPPDSVEIGGVVLMLNAPKVWPNSGTMTPAGSVVSVSLDSVSGFATERVLDLDKSKTPCKYEKSSMYNQETCLSMCKRAYVVEYCGCNPAFLFPTNSQRDCNVEDFLCLVDHNDVFNDYYVLTDEITDFEHRAMICDCPPECEYYEYNSQFTTVPIYESSNIILDVHFGGQTSFRYKTDIVITQLDLLVSFGGIIGLFLGGSLLSMAELIYYLMAAVFSYLRSSRESGKKGATAVKPGPTWPSTIQALPILDYGPLKPRSRKIPILVNWDPPKSSVKRY